MASKNTIALRERNEALRKGASVTRPDDPADMSRPARRRRLMAERKKAKAK